MPRDHLDGTKIPLGLAEGATENATVVGDLLVGLRARGLDVARPILVVLDGAKALGRAVTEGFDHRVIQRCQLPKLPNVTDRLPKRMPPDHAMDPRRSSTASRTTSQLGNAPLGERSA